MNQNELYCLFNMKNEMYLCCFIHGLLWKKFNKKSLFIFELNGLYGRSILYTKNNDVMPSSNLMNYDTELVEFCLPYRRNLLMVKYENHNDIDFTKAIKI